MEILKKVKEIQKGSLKQEVNNRLSEFSAFSKKDTKEWFSELCFCILTANSKALTAINIQNTLGANGFCNHSHNELVECIIYHKHRFHNNKSKYIIEARQFIDIKNIITKIVKEQGEFEAREWIVKNIKGLGYKEASHFLRNVGFFSVSILDRHILNLFLENDIIKEKPSSLNKKTYIEIEQIFINMAKKMKMSAAELDLYMWFLKTGKVLK